MKRMVILIVFILSLYPGPVSASGYVQSRGFQTSDAYSPNPDHEPYTIEFFTRCTDGSTRSAWLQFWNSFGLLDPEGRYYNYLSGHTPFVGMKCDSLWHHIALVKTVQEVRIYVDGTERIHFSGSSAIHNTPWIFQNTYNTYELDSYRVSDGQRYTTDFSPPKSELARDEATLKLFLYNRGVEFTNHYGNWVYDDQGKYYQWLGEGTVIDGGIPSQPIPGDANGDFEVDGSDFTIWSTNYLKSGQGPQTGDFNSDSAVDGKDYLIWIRSYQTSLSGAGKLIPDNPSSYNY